MNTDCHIVRIDGPPQSGKTRLGVDLLAMAHGRGERVLMVRENRQVSRAVREHFSPLWDIVSKEGRPSLVGYDLVVVDCGDYFTPLEIEAMRLEMSSGGKGLRKLVVTGTVGSEVRL